MRRLLNSLAVILFAVSPAAAETERERLEKELVDGLVAAAATEAQMRGMEPGEERDALEVKMVKGQKAVEPLFGKLRLTKDSELLDLVKFRRPGDLPAVERLLLGDGSVQALNRLKLASVLVSLYESAKKRFPPVFEDVYAAKVSDTKPEDLRCGICGAAPVYIKPAKDDMTDAEAIILHCAKAHPDGTRCLATFQGAARKVPEAVFQKALAAGSLKGLMPAPGPVRSETKEENGKRTFVVTLKISGLQPAETGVRVRVRGRFSGGAGPAGETRWLRFKEDEGREVDCTLELPLAEGVREPVDLDLTIYDEVAKIEERAYLFLGRRR